MRRVLAVGLLLLAQPSVLPAAEPPKAEAPAGADTLGYGPVPAWVMPPPAFAPTQSNEAFTFELFDSQSRVTGAGIEGYSMLRMTARSPEALEAVGSALNITWQPDISRIVVHQARLIRPGETVDLLAGGTRMTLLRREENLERAALDGQLTAILQPEGIRVGDTVEFAFSVQTVDPVLAGNAQLQVSNMLDAEVRHLRYTLDWSKRPGFRAFAGERLKARRTPTSLAFELKEVPQRQFPANAPTRYLQSSAVEGTSFASWAEVSALLAPLYTAAATLPPQSAVRTEARRIAAAYPDKASRMLAALRLVQDDVRYLFLGMDLGGYRPASAEETWARRFGDCKGKTALLLALLAELDIPAQAALVHSELGDGLDARLPMPAQFDHVIVRAELDGRTYWLDGTGTGDRGLEALSPPPLHWALPLGPGTTALEKLVPLAPRQPLSELDLDVDASAGLDRPGKATIVRLFRGTAAAALRSEIQLIPEAQRQTALKQYFEEDWERFTPDRVVEQWDDARGELKLTSNGSFDLDLTPGPGTLTYYFPSRQLAMPKPFDRDDTIDREDQALPFRIPFPYDEVERHSLTLPRTGKKLAVGEPDIDRELAGWRMQRRIRSEGDRITIEIRERTLKPEIPHAAAVAARAEMVELNQSRPQVTLPDGQGASKAAPKASPEQAGIWTGLKAVLDAAGPDAALKAMDAMPPGTVDDPMFQAMRWNLMAQAGRGDEAAKLAAAAVAASPDNPTLLVGQAKVLGLLRRNDEAVKALDRRLALGPDAEALTMRAELGTNLPLAERLKDLEKANRLAPRYSMAWSIRGLVLARAGKPREAMAAADEALAHFPNDTLALALRSELKKQAGDNAGALADLDRLIELEPKNAIRWNERCWLRAIGGAPPADALPDCNRALELAPTFAAALDSRGLVHLQMGKLKEALADYEAALVQEPDMAASLWGRGVTRRRMGDTAGGDADLARARKISPTIDTYMATSGVKP